MSKNLRFVGILSSVLSFALCLFGGLWILSHVNFSDRSDAPWVGMGFYFIGKGIFVGALLLLVSLGKPNASGEI